jgi:polar amino acid transport system substrate-binding protein
LVIAADATYAPNEFIGADGKTVVGMDPDLAQALGRVLGLKVDVVNASFDTIIPGLASGKYDLGMSSFTDTKAREKVVDFVTYFSAGTSFYVQQGGPAIASLADLCGHSVAVERGTIQADDATAQSHKCTAAGKPAVRVSVYPDQNAANLAISSGRAEVGMADSPVADYIVKQSDGQFELTGKPYATAPYGIAVPKGSGLAKPVLDALGTLMKDGSYQSVLTKWGIQEGAITNPQLNGAIS